MALTEIQGSDIELLVRADGVGGFLTMTCEDTVFLEVTNPVTSSSTKCGTFKGIGSPEFKLNGTAVHNVTPAGTEVSYDEVLTYQTEITKVNWVLRNKAFGAFAAGNAIRMSGDAYFVSTQYDGSNGVAAKFSWNMEGTGVLNTVES